MATELIKQIIEELLEEIVESNDFHLHLTESEDDDHPPSPENMMAPMIRVQNEEEIWILIQDSEEEEDFINGMEIGLSQLSCSNSVKFFSPKYVTITTITNNSIIMDCEEYNDNLSLV